jgi:hypothetical protein
VAEVGVHDDDVVALGELEPVDVRCSETQLAGAGVQVDVWGVGFDELLGYCLGSVGGTIVDDY